MCMAVRNGARLAPVKKENIVKCRFKNGTKNKDRAVAGDKTSPAAALFTFLYLQFGTVSAACFKCFISVATEEHS